MFNKRKLLLQRPATHQVWIFQPFCPSHKWRTKQGYKVTSMWNLYTSRDTEPLQDIKCIWIVWASAVTSGMWAVTTHKQLWNKTWLFQELSWDFLSTSRRHMLVLKDSLKHSKLLADQFASCTGRKELSAGNWIWAFAERPDTLKRWAELLGLLFELSKKRMQQESRFGEKLFTSNTQNIL